MDDGETAVCYVNTW